jgi:multidrug efflux pump subunit AcrB
MIRFIVQKKAAVFTLSVLIILAGVTSYLNLPKEASPEIKQPYIFVTTIYPGVGAKDVENLVTRPIEDEIDGVEGLEEVVSTSQQSLSFIFATFSSGVSVETALRRVQERVDIAKAELPDDVEDPVAQELSSSNWPVIIVSLSHPEGLEVIDRAAERVRDEVRRVPGVLDAELTGQLEKEVAIELDPAKLEHYDLTIDDIVFAVQMSNVAIPGGILKNPAKNYSISVNTEIKNPRAFEEVVVQSGPVKVPLRDLGTVRFTYAEPETYSRFNGAPSISISITKRTGENIIDIVDEAKARIEAMRNSLPEGTRIGYTADQSRYIRQIVADLENNMFTGFALVMLVTIFFLGTVNSLFVSLAIPFSMLLSFSVLEAMGITLNMVVLFSLILALGMLVDNGIVIVENIFRHGTMGKSQEQAAIEGSSEVAAPIIASTITTCLAFMPIIFMPGVMGDFMSYLPKTVIVVLISSLLVALTINPVFCSKFLRIDEKSRKRMTEGGGLFARVQGWYVRRVTRAIDHAVIVLLLSFAVVITGIVLYGAFGKEVAFFPVTDPINAVVNLELAQGTPLAKTDSLVRAVERVVDNVPASIDNIQATSGKSGEDDIASGMGDEFNKGHIRIAFEPYLERDVKAGATIDSLKERLRELTGAQTKVEPQEMGPPSGHAVSYEVVGDNYEVLGRIADSIVAIMRRYPEFKLVDTDYQAAKPELSVTVDRRKAAYYGLSVQAIAGTIRNAINGSTIGTFRQGEEDYDIVVRYQDNYRNTIDHLEGLHIVKKGVRYPIAELATIERSSAVGVIKRRNFQRAVGVWGDFREEVQNKGEIGHEIEEAVTAMPLPPGYRIEAGEGEEMRNEASEFLVRAFVIALFLIAIVLVAQFNSIVQPLIIMASVFLSMGGVFWGYFLSGQNFIIIMSGIGSIALAGVAVNNCIVLVDYTNILLRRGMHWRDAVIEAGKTRLRPVLLTAITTVLGLLPMALGVSIDVHPGSFGIQVGSETSEFWRAFAWAMIYGLTFATVMTLVMVPCMLALSFRLFPPKKAEAMSAEKK